MSVNPQDVVARARMSYEQGELDERLLSADPLHQFELWMHAAIEARVPEPNAMALATASGGGEPDVRIVLLRGYDAGGFCFYSNYESAKGRELAANPRAALNFYWAELERQVRISGRVERLSQEQSAAYFATRPRGHQLGAWASRQSEVVASREALERALAEVEGRFPGEVPLPKHWGGYRVVPEAMEFWQGRPNRLHDRIRYRRDGELWLRERLGP